MMSETVRAQSRCVTSEQVSVTPLVLKRWHFFTFSRERHRHKAGAEREGEPLL